MLKITRSKPKIEDLVIFSSWNCKCHACIYKEMPVKGKVKVIGLKNFKKRLPYYKIDANSNTKAIIQIRWMMLSITELNLCLKYMIRP